MPSSDRGIELLPVYLAAAGELVEGEFVGGEVNMSPKLRIGCNGTDRSFGINPGM